MLVLSERVGARRSASALILAGLLVLAAPEVRRPGYGARMTTVDTVTAALREEILSGERPAGARLVEPELCARYGVARHSLRAALRALPAEGLVRVETNRGARVARLDAQDILQLYELRTALEVEAARLALERHDGRCPPASTARSQLERACESGTWGEINLAHAGLHSAIVAAAGSPRIEAAHNALDGELQLFMNQLEPLWSRERMAADHIALVRGLERDGPAALRGHLGESAAALVAAEKGLRTAGPCRRPSRPVEERGVGVRSGDKLRSA